MILYLDTSSLLKLYIIEPHSDLVHRWTQQVEGELAVRHGLRGFDAIHLAAAAEIARAGSVPVFFSSFDVQLNKAAMAEQFTVLDQDASPDVLAGTAG